MKIGAEYEALVIRSPNEDLVRECRYVEQLKPGEEVVRPRAFSRNFHDTWRSRSAPRLDARPAVRPLRRGIGRRDGVTKLAGEIFWFSTTRNGDMP
jgi:hypothetical protein